MSWISFTGFRGGPGAVAHGHGSHDQNVTASAASPSAPINAASSASAAAASSQNDNAPSSASNTPCNGEQTLDIRRNMIKCAELKKLKTRFYNTEVLRKKFFVLYEDSRRSVTHPRDHSADQSDEEDENYEPARLEYFNNQKNWEAGERPKRSIVLRDAFNITRKKDTQASIHKFVIAIYTVEACLSIVLDTEELMNTWLEMLISCQMGGRDIQGRLPKPKYENIYEVDVQHFEPELASNSFQMTGSYRMVVTSTEVKFFAVGSSKPLSFHISSIRASRVSKANRRLFKLEIGRCSESGAGVLVMKCNDEEISDSIQMTVHAAMRALKENNANIPRRPRNSSSSFNQNNIRIRTNSWSNMDKRRGSSIGASSSVSAKPIIHHHQRQHSAGIDRHRTTSEGNTHFDLKRSLRGGGGKSITSGSPMSPGSFVSSESAGSSNSLDEADGAGNNGEYRIMTPIDDHMGPATIFEESSAESCVEQLQYGVHINPASIKQPTTMESRLADSVVSNQLSQDKSTARLDDSNVNYTPIDILPSSTAAGYTIADTGTNSNMILASSPPGTSTHYSTILMDATQAVALSGVSALSSTSVTSTMASASNLSLKDENSYVIMSPPTSSSLSHHPNESEMRSRGEISIRQHKPLSGLIADHEFEDTSASSVTSPNSQSSYNPLLDEVQTDDSSAYMVMSPATSASSGGGSRMGTAPRRISHQRSGSNSLLKSSNNGPTSDYVDMSPASKSGVPIPNRNEHTASLSFGTSPSAALTSHLVSYGDATIVNKTKTPSSSEDSPYLIMSPVDPSDRTSEFSNRHATPPIKLRTASIDSTGTAGSSSIGARPKTSSSTRGRFSRGQSDSQRSSLCFDDHWNDLGISPQDSSGGTLMGVPSDVGHEPLDYAPMDISRSTTISKAELDSLQPIVAVSRLRIDNDVEPLDLDVEDDDDEENDDEAPTSNTIMTNPRAYSVGCRPPTFLTGSSSSVSTTGSVSSHHHHSRHKSRFIDIPGATTASGTSGTGTGSHSSSISPGTALMTGQSPSSITARLGSWIRHRTGSVPSKSALSGRRRHRTQSEGEKDEL